MRTILTKALVLSGFMVALSGCMMFPLGPDLAKAPSPFGDAPKVTFVAPEKGQDVNILHTPDGDSTVIEVGDVVTGIGSRSAFSAGVTWYALDGNDPGHDYWLVGLNIFRTPDRSAYVILRHPHGLKLARPMESDGFEILPVTCTLRGIDPFAKPPEPDAAAAPVDGTVETPAPEMLPPPAEEPPCDFVDMAEVRTVVSTILTKAREDELSAKTESTENASAYIWQKLKVRLP